MMMTFFFQGLSAELCPHPVLQDTRWSAHKLCSGGGEVEPRQGPRGKSSERAPTTSWASQE